MILTIIASLASFCFAYLYGKTLKKYHLAIESLNSIQSRCKNLSYDTEISQRERERLLDRNSYLEGRLEAYTRENEILGAKNVELTQLYSLAKEDANKLKFQLIELEESMKPKPSVKKIKLVRKK